MGTAILYGGGGGGVPVDEMTNPAVAGDVYSGDTFASSSSEELITGTVADKTTSHTQTLNEKWTIPAGYHNGTGKVTQNLTYVGKQTATIGNNGSVAINAGYHNGQGKITANNPTYAGGAVYPGTSNATIATNGKVLNAKLYIPAQPILTTGNIVRGKSIFGVAGSFDTVATIYRDQQVYNGSSFSGLFSGGVITMPHPRYKDGSYRYGSFNEATVENFAIKSGALYSKEFNRYNSNSTDYPAICIVPKSLNFSKISKVRFKGNWICGVRTWNTQSQAYVEPYITVKALTKSGTTVTVVGTAKAVALCGKWTHIPSQYEESWGSSGSVAFDAECDISNITNTNAFLEIDINPGRTATNDAHTDWRDMTVNITGIWLYV